MFYVYVLKSLKDGNLYKGFTFDIAKRLIAHNSGKVKSTAFRRPLELIYIENFSTCAGARRREYFFKTPKGARELKKKLSFEIVKIAGWSSPVARQAHNLKAAGSNPAPAIFTIQSSPALGP